MIKKRIDGMVVTDICFQVRVDKKRFTIGETTTKPRMERLQEKPKGRPLDPETDNFEN